MRLTVEEINQKLKTLAFRKTTPFCYSCYQDCPNGVCPTCGSDDLMRHLDGVGVEFGTDWVIKAIVEEQLSEVDLSDSFAELIADCYGETTKIGFLEYPTVDALKELDPIAYSLALDEHLDFLIEDEQIMEIAGKHYWIHDVVELVE
jgi:hypothetical protein